MIYCTRKKNCIKKTQSIKIIKASIVYIMKLYVSNYNVPTSHCLREYIKNKPLNSERIGPKEKVQIRTKRL